MINYVSMSRPGSSFGAKPITRPYAEALTAAGLVIVSNYQYDKPGGTAPSDFTRGFAGVVADARTAWQLHTAAGGARSAPIFFSVDDDINRNTWKPRAAVIPRNQLGVGCAAHRHLWRCQYVPVGGWRRCHWELEGARPPVGLADPLLAARPAIPGAVLYQRIVSTALNPDTVVGGLEVDVSDVLAPDCGQWNLHP